MISGPIVGALVNKYGCRAVGIAGSLTGAAAFLISTLSPNVLVLQLTYGLLGGKKTDFEVNHNNRVLVPQLGIKNKA